MSKIEEIKEQLSREHPMMFREFVDNANTPSPRPLFRG